MNAPLSPELLRQVDLYVDNRHTRFEELGTSYFQQFGGAGKNVSSQVRNLQQLVCSATRLSDVEDFVKNQMGRKSGTSKPWREVGEETLKQLHDLREKAKELAKSKGPEVALQLRMQLARGWVRAVVSHYLYEKALAEMKEKE